MPFSLQDIETDLIKLGFNTQNYTGDNLDMEVRLVKLPLTRAIPKVDAEAKVKNLELVEYEVNGPKLAGKVAKCVTTLKNRTMPCLTITCMTKQEAEAFEVRVIEGIERLLNPAYQGDPDQAMVALFAKGMEGMIEEAANDFDGVVSLYPAEGDAMEAAAAEGDAG